MTASVDNSSIHHQGDLYERSRINSECNEPVPDKPDEMGDEADGEEGGSDESAEESDEGTPGGGDVDMRGEEADDDNADGESTQ